MILKNNERTRLNPVLALQGYFCVFDGEPGTYLCKIHVHMGTVQFSHDAYSPITGGWDDCPGNNEERRMLFHESEPQSFRFTLDRNDGQLDSVIISNHLWTEPAEFTLNYEMLGRRSNQSAGMPGNSICKERMTLFCAAREWFGTSGISCTEGSGFRGSF